VNFKVFSKAAVRQKKSVSIRGFSSECLRLEAFAHSRFTSYATRVRHRQHFAMGVDGSSNQVQPAASASFRLPVSESSIRFRSERIIAAV